MAFGRAYELGGYLVLEVCRFVDAARFGIDGVNDEMTAWRSTGEQDQARDSMFAWPYWLEIHEKRYLDMYG